jgi:two-component system NtrC family sensor kinase
MEGLERFWNWVQDHRLQATLILSFSLIAAITNMTGTWATTRVIRNYLTQEEIARIRRGMSLGRDVYGDATQMLVMAAERVAAHAGASLATSDQLVSPAIPQQVALETRLLPFEGNRFVVVLDAEANALYQAVYPTPSGAMMAASWTDLPVVAATLAGAHAGGTTEIVSVSHLGYLGLAEQAAIEIIQTPKAAPDLYDPREGHAGLVLLASVPIVSPQGRISGAVLAGHLLNNDFTLVDKIKQIGQLDTVTVFFGDLRVSTNVLTAEGKRAIGTRVSEEVSRVVLSQAEIFEERAFVVNQWYITRYEPLRNYRQQVVGSLYVGMREKGFLGLVSAFNERIFVIAGGSILMAFLIAIPVTRSIVRPLAGVVDASHRVAEGDMAVRVPVQGRGELATLGRGFNEMVATLERTREELLRKEKLAAVGQLAAGVAHEINNPLGTILLYADTMHQEAGSQDPRAADYQMIIKETLRCKHIVSDLLNFARQRQLMVRDTDLNALIRQLMEELPMQTALVGVKVTLDLDPALPLIQADEAQIRQIFINLIDNAADAMDGHGRLWVRTRHISPNMVEVTFQDTGAGIPPEHLKEIFTPFFTTKPVGKGTGLGLSIVYGIIKMHQGQIHIDSQVGQGSTFTITLPLCPPDRLTNGIVT